MVYESSGGGGGGSRDPVARANLNRIPASDVHLTEFTIHVSLLVPFIRHALIFALIPRHAYTLCYPRLCVTEKLTLHPQRETTSYVANGNIM